MSFDDAGWKALLRLVEGGRCWVKLAAPYHGSRAGPPDYANAGALATALIRAAPYRMLYARHWPHPSLKSNHPDDGALLDQLCEWAGSDSVRKQILVDNQARLYRF